VNPKLAIALDLGGTQIRAALVDATGKVHKRFATETQARAGADVVVQQLADAYWAIAQDVAPEAVRGVGLCSPGPLDTAKGIAIHLPTIMGFENFPLVAALTEKMGRKVLLENDGIAAAIGEWKFGAGADLQSVVYVTVSTGIGGGVIVDGHVLRGRKGMAGHVGHMAIAQEGKRCGCGNAGCWEAYAAGPAFAERAREAAKLQPSSTLHPLGPTLTPEDVFKAALKADPLALNLVEEQSAYLGMGITSLLYLFSPDVVIVGGGLSNAFDQLYPGIVRYVSGNAMLVFRDTPIVKAALGGNSGLIGAAALVFADQS
jgi:glucokinase